MNLPDKLPNNMTLEAIVSSKPESGSGSSKGKRETSISDRFSWPGRIALLLAIVLSPWAFASVESWAQRWVTISLLVGMAFWWFETALNEKKSQVFPYVFFPVLLGLLIGLCQTIPLPAWLGELILGRQQEIYSNFTGDINSAASISLDRGETWKQIRLLVIASMGLLLGCRYFRTKRDLVLLMSVVAANGVAISFFGIVHKLTDNGLMFWYHKVELGGQHFGPFINRNNGAGYLCMSLACALGLIPIVMAKRKGTGPGNIISKEIPIWRQFSLYFLEFVSELTATKMAVLLGAVFISAGVVATISRGGVLAMLAAGIITVLVYGMARKPKNSFIVMLPFVGLAVVLSAWIGFGEEITKRFEQTDITNVATADARIQNWVDTWPAVGDMGLLGSGLGSYRGVHRLYRTDEETAIFVYAENQFFQSVIDAGWFALVLFLLAWFLAFQYANITLFKGSSPTTIGVGTMGVFLIASQFVASLFDFGIYICANMLLFAVLTGFLAFHGHSLAGRLKEKSWLRFQMPNYVAQIVVLVMFAAGTLVALDLHRRASMERIMKPYAKNFDRFSMPLEETDRRIEVLGDGVKRVHSVKALNYLGELWLHRSRLQMFADWTTHPDYQVQIKLLESKGTELAMRKKQAMVDDLWSRTDVPQVYDAVCYIRQQSKRDAINFVNEPPIRENFPQAANQFLLSSRASPLQPVAHLKLGEIKAVIGKVGDGDQHFERALQLAPTNSSFRLLAAVTYFLSGNNRFAATHFKRYLELMPIKFKSVMDIVTGRTTLSVIPLPDKMIVDEVIPNDAKMLFEFDQKYLADKLNVASPLRQRLLEKAITCIDEQKHTRRDNAVLKGDIYSIQGKMEEAASQYDFALMSQPNDPKTRYKIAVIYEDLGDLENALKHAQELRTAMSRRDSIGRKYKAMLERIEKKERKASSQ